MKPYESAFWDARFSNEEYIFGTDPALFLRDHIHRIPPQSDVLVPADGEGRNSLFLAQHGHTVTATDISLPGLTKARTLALRHNVHINSQHIDLHTWDWPEAAFDAVVAIFIQFSPPEQRAHVFQGVQKALRPGGMVLVHGYTPKQLDYGTGGPPNVEHLYTEELLRDHFQGWNVTHARSYERELQEGTAHCGMSALIDFIAHKPS